VARAARRAGRQAQSPGLLVTALVAACANLGDPPGGPPDTTPPHIVSVRPESGAVVVGWKDDAVIQFNEVIDEMPGKLANQVLLSPVAGDVQVSWGRTKIRVKPKEGWKPGRVYRLQLLPGIVDLRRNRSDSGRVVLFSTGPAIGDATLAGTALQWVEQRALPGALIEAAVPPDSVGTRTLADSSGQFRLAGLRPGRYVAYAAADQNGNRRRDWREAYDSTLVTLDSTATATLFTFVHDTVGPRPRGATMADSITVRLDFTQALDPTARLDTSRLRVVQLPDSTPVPIAAALTPPQYDSLTAAARAAAKPDTGAARDTTARRDSAAAGVRGARGAAPLPTAARVDTGEVRRLLAQRRVPWDKVILRFARPLAPNTRYLIRVRGAVNLNGAAADGQVVVTTPKPAPPDTTSHAPRPTPPRP
jgi:hypothetical protein